MQELTRTWRPGRPVDMVATLSTLRRGAGDPSWRTTDGAVLWWATGTPDGAALLRLRQVAGEVLAQAWGPGAAWVLDGVPLLLGQADDPAGFRPHAGHPRLLHAWRSRPGWRVPRSRRVLDALTAAGVEQVVTGREARASWRALVLAVGEPAPGAPAAEGGPAAGMRLPPTPQAWRSVPSWQWLRAGVGESRRRVVLAGARSASALERTLTLPAEQVERALRSLPGVGVWTAAETRQRAHGDPDAFSFADYHVGRDVTWALTGEALDDEACAEVIACYAGHRYRVQRLLELDGARRPRHGPRRSLPTHLP